MRLTPRSLCFCALSTSPSALGAGRHYTQCKLAILFISEPWFSTMERSSPGPWDFPQSRVRGHWRALWQKQDFSMAVYCPFHLPSHCSLLSLCPYSLTWPLSMTGTPPPHLYWPSIRLPHIVFHVTYMFQACLGMFQAWPFPLGCLCHTGQVASGLDCPHAVFSGRAERRRCLVPQPQSLVRKKLKATQFWLISL